MSFVLYADCDVEYVGRARSKLARGNYLIIYKDDQSLLIHGADSIIPRNYQGAGTVLETTATTITAKRKSEIIKINIYNTIHEFKTENWSRLPIAIFDTEKELVQKLQDNISQYVVAKIVDVVREYKTPVGNIDLLVIDELDRYYVFEVKRKLANIAAASQLHRYIQYFQQNGIKCKGFLVAPAFGKSTVKLCSEYQFNLIQLAF